MKKTLFQRATVLAGICIMAGLMSAQDATKAASSVEGSGAVHSGKPLKVLIIGNSFMAGVMHGCAHDALAPAKSR